MKSLFDSFSFHCSQRATEVYSTSFAMATKMLSPSIRADIYNIYGFVRLADEIVDSFHGYGREKLFNRFEQDLEQALEERISLNPVLNAFQHTYYQYQMPPELVTAFMKSMRMDLYKQTYATEAEFREYIYGSADVVGLMCLRVFVRGDEGRYEALKSAAMALGSAFQKVNFLRDLKADYEQLNRSYFPKINLLEMDERAKAEIEEEILNDFKQGFQGIVLLPTEAKFGVYTAYKYYFQLLRKLQRTPSVKLRQKRIRVPNYQKFGLLASSYVNYKLNLL